MATTLPHSLPLDVEKRQEIIRRWETALFWLERIMIVTVILLPTWVDNYFFPNSVSFTIILGFIASNCSYSSFYMDRQQIRPPSFESIVVFCLERIGMWGVVLKTFGLPADFGHHILKLTQLFLIGRYIQKNAENIKGEGSKMVEPHEGSEIINKCLRYCLCGLRLLFRGFIHAINSCRVQLWDSKDANLLPDGSKQESKTEAEVESGSESENMSNIQSAEEKEDETDSESEVEDEDEAASESEEETKDAESVEGVNEEEESVEEESEDAESMEEESEDETDSVSDKVDVMESKIMNHAMDLCTKLLRGTSELKENLTLITENYQTKIEGERRMWEEEKQYLSAKIKHYQSAMAENAAERQKLDEEKEALNKRIQKYERELSMWDKVAKIFQEKQEVLSNYSNHLEEKRNLEVELQFTKKLVEEYKAGYLEKLDLEARLSTEASVVESLNRENSALEAKCRSLEEEKGELTGKLSAAREACELYRSYLRDWHNGFRSVQC